MKRNVLMLGAVALVVIGCVIAAGCTSAQQTGSDEKFIGAWTHTTDDDVVVIVMKEGGSGYYLSLAKEPAIRLLKYAPLNWTVNADGTVTHVIEDRVEPIIMTYDAENDLFNDDHGYTVKRMDPITGTWFHEGIESTSGKHAKISNVLKIDGTGTVFLAYDDGSMRVTDVVWQKNADGTYALSYGNGFNVTWTMDPENITALTSVANKTMQKKFTDTSYYLSILGPWYDSENKWITFFNADGTGTTYKENGTAEDAIVFTWDVPEFGTFLLHFQNGMNPSGGNLAGQDKVWTYDRVNNTFITHAGTSLVRPSDAVGDLTFERF